MLESSQHQDKCVKYAMDPRGPGYTVDIPGDLTPADSFKIALTSKNVEVGMATSYTNY